MPFLGACFTVQFFVEFYTHRKLLWFFISAFLLKLTASRYHLRPPPVLIMDAQWQQYYWNHYLLHQQQLASVANTAHYTPTTAYGPMGHSIRTHQQHQAHPYTPSPSTSPPSHTPPSHTPPATTSPAFPPPPPPPLPTASPTTPQPKSFQHSPTHSAPPAPPATVPFPTPTIQESWRSTESCWDANAVHGHQLHRHIQPMEWHVSSLLLGIGNVVDMLWARVGLWCWLGNVEGRRCRFWRWIRCRPSMRGGWDGCWRCGRNIGSGVVGARRRNCHLWRIIGW